MNTSESIATTQDDGLIARLASQRTKFRAAVETLTEERDGLKKDRDRLTKENATLIESTSAKRIAELEQVIRNRSHGDIFKRLAKDAGADERGLDDLYSLSGWKAEKDEADEDAIKKLVEDIKAKKPLYFPETEDGLPLTDRQSADEKPVKRVAGGDRGGSHDKTKSGIRLTASNLADPTFMLNPKNKELILSAAKEGRIRLPDREAQ